MPFTINILGLPLRAPLVSEAVMTTEADTLLSWSLQTADALLGAQLSEHSPFTSGVQELSAAIFAVDGARERNARQILADIVNGLGLNHQWPRIFSNRESDEINWILVPDQRFVVTKWEGGSYNHWNIRFLDAKKVSAKVAAILKGKTKTPIRKRAMQFGYDFSIAIKYCFESQNPSETASTIETRIKYYKERGVEVKEFHELTNIDKIALYAAAKRNFQDFIKDPKKTGRNCSFPSFSSFLKYLKMVMSYPQSDYVKGATDPHSDFTWMATMDYASVAGSLRLKAKWPWPSRETLRPYDVLLQLYENQINNGVLTNAFNEAHTFLRRRDELNSALVFYDILTTIGKGTQQIEAAVRLLGSQVYEPAYWELFLTAREPLQAVTKYWEYIKEYEKNPDLTKSSMDMSPEEIAALYYILIKPKGRYCKHLGTKLTFERFQLYLMIESHGAFLRKELLPFDQLTQNINNLDLGLEARSISVSELLKLKELISDLIRYRNQNPQNDDLFHKIRGVLVKGDPELNTAFLSHYLPSMATDTFEALLDLYLAGYPIQGHLYLKYLQAESRREKLLNVEKRAQELATTASDIGSLDDPFEVMAIQRLLLQTPLTYYLIKFVLETVKIPPQNSLVQVSSFQFDVGLESISIRKNSDKRFIFGYCERIKKIMDVVEWTQKVLQSFRANFPKALRQNIYDFFHAQTDEDMQYAISTLSQERALEFIDTMIKAMEEHGKWNQEVLEGMLLAVTWHREPVAQRPIERYHKKRTETEIVEALRSVFEFYTDHFPRVVKRYFGELGPEQKMVETAHKQLKNLYDIATKNRVGTAKVVLLPARTKLDAFFSFMAQNSIATEEFALHGLLDDDFVPFRILIDGQWKGTVMTYTKMIDGKKVLIITGIDPQLDVMINLSEFMDGLHNGFLEIAKRGEYKLVVLPAVIGMRSSRRVSVMPEIRKRYSKNGIIRVKEPIGFPRKGMGEEATAFYNNKKQNRFLVMIPESAIKKIRP